MKNAKNRAITDLNAPNGSRDIPFQSQEFGQDGHCHFVGFQPHFQFKYDVTDAILQDNEKMKVQYLRSLLFDLFETLQAVRTWQRNFASFEILLLWQLEPKLLSVIEKTKGLLFKQK